MSYAFIKIMFIDRNILFNISKDKNIIAVFSAPSGILPHTKRTNTSHTDDSFHDSLSQLHPLGEEPYTGKFWYEQVVNLEITTMMMKYTVSKEKIFPRWSFWAFYSLLSPTSSSQGTSTKKSAVKLTDITEIIKSSTQAEFLVVSTKWTNLHG